MNASTSVNHLSHDEIRVWLERTLHGRETPPRLTPDESEYAQALALAFLDESKVAALERYERWRALEPLAPVGTGRPT